MKRRVYVLMAYSPQSASGALVYYAGNLPVEVLGRLSHHILAASDPSRQYLQWRHYGRSYEV